MTVPWAEWDGSAEVKISGGPLWFGRRIAAGPKDEAALAGAQALWEAMFQGD
mgnify:CR=1 FL=1